MTDHELYHHGILGQKWGIRRYQNEDGTLTSAGKKRYSDGETSSTKKNNNVENNKSKRKMHPLVSTLLKGSIAVAGETFVSALFADSIIGDLAAIAVPITSVATGASFYSQVLNECDDLHLVIAL